MIWVILAALGVPLWLCAVGAFMLLLHNRRLRKRPGNMAVRVLRPGKKRWTRGHAIWVSNVFAWRSSPAGWNEDLLEVTGLSSRAVSQEEHKKLHRFADDPVIVSLALAEGQALEVAVQPEQRFVLSGPFRRRDQASVKASV